MLNLLEFGIERVKKVVEKSKIFQCRVFETVEELIQTVDVVYVLTNMETHHQYASQAIDAGKHVLVKNQQQ